MKFAKLIIITGLLVLAPSVYAGISVSPYVSIKSTKSIKPQSAGSSSASKTKQRQEYGVRGSVSFWRLFSLQVGVGQSTLTTTEKSVDAVDEYDQIDLKKDGDLNTDDPDSEFKMTETQDVAKATVILDPGFWIFIARFKAGVTAKQRTVKVEELGKDAVTIKPGPTYNPHSGFGLGVKLGRTMKFMIESSFEHYKFPEIEPFEREVSVSFSVNL